MYFHPSKHIYLSYFGENLIILDLRKNDYQVLDSHTSKNLYSILENSFVLRDNKYYIETLKTYEYDAGYEALIVSLIKGGIISTEPKEYSFVSKFHNSDQRKKGAASLIWAMNPHSLNSIIPFKQILKAYITLIKVDSILKFFGFDHLINFIKNKYRRRKIYLTNLTKEEDIKDITFSLNKACFYYLHRVKCLEWAAAFVLLSLEKGINSKLVIGVQNNPFNAHAWVEIDGKVIEDLAALPKQMAVILREPQ